MPRPPVRVRLNKVRFRPPRERSVPTMPKIFQDHGRRGTYDEHPEHYANAQRKARLVAEHMSWPDSPLSIQKIANATWVKGPGENITAERPFTLRELADPEANFPEHGQLIFVFRNVQTNQILYSLTEVLDESHLKQIPFFAKHSTPPSLRRDVWTPHCVVSFPTPEQGHNAFRKLREFRKMHELYWDKTDPEWTKYNDKTRMRKIMNQRANTTADLAKVLSLQAEHGVVMQQKLDDREKQRNKFLHGKGDVAIDEEKDSKTVRKRKEEQVKGTLAAVKEMATLAETGEVNRLAVERNNLTWRLNRIRPGKNDKLAERLKKAITANKNRSDRLLWARRRAFALNKAQRELGELATAEDKTVEKLKQSLHWLEENLKNLTLHDRIINRRKQIAEKKHELSVAQAEADEKAALAREQVDGDNYAVRRLLPRHLTIPLPTPYVAEGVEIQWADLLDGEYAKDQWPEGVVHTVLPLTEQRTQTTPMRPEEFEEEVEKDRQRIFEDWLKKYEELNSGSGETKEKEMMVEEPEEKTGLRKYLPIPALKNPLKRAEA